MKAGPRDNRNPLPASFRPIIICYFSSLLVPFKSQIIMAAEHFLYAMQQTLLVRVKLILALSSELFCSLISSLKSSLIN